MYLNKAIVCGNLTRDPELKALPSGIKIASFSVATNRVWKDKNGAKQESADYHNIIVFGSQAESCGQWLKKGQQALIEGRLQTRSWDNKGGQKQYRTEIVADRVQFGTRPNAGQAQSHPIEPSIDSDTRKPVNADKGQEKVGPIGGVGGIEYPEEEINPDDIPF